MLTTWPKYTAGILRLVSHDYETAPDETLKSLEDHYWTVWSHYCRNTPEAQAAAELHRLIERGRKKADETM